MRVESPKNSTNAKCVIFLFEHEGQ